MHTCAHPHVDTDREHTQTQPPTQTQAQTQTQTHTQMLQDKSTTYMMVQPCHEQTTPLTRRGEPQRTEKIRKNGTTTKNQETG